MKCILASIPTAISGTIRLYIAFILTQQEPKYTLILGAFFLILSIYSLDRLKDYNERTKIPAFFYILGTVLYFIENKLEVPIILIITGYLYTFGMRNLRLKAGYGIKNIVVGFSWGFSIAYSLESFNKFIFIFYFFKLFINSAYFDLKDIKEDCIKTLPKLLGKGFKPFLLVLNIFYHLIAIVEFSLNILLISSLVLTQIAIMYNNEKRSRLIIDFEAIFSYLLYLFYKNFF